MGGVTNQSFDERHRPCSSHSGPAGLPYYAAVRRLPAANPRIHVPGRTAAHRRGAAAGPAPVSVAMGLTNSAAGNAASADRRRSDFSHQRRPQAERFLAQVPRSTRRRHASVAGLPCRPVAGSCGLATNIGQCGRKSSGSAVRGRSRAASGSGRETVAAVGYGCRNHASGVKGTPCPI